LVPSLSLTHTLPLSLPPSHTHTHACNISPCTTQPPLQVS
jgi:hypothetical protein